MVGCIFIFFVLLVQLVTLVRVRKSGRQLIRFAHDKSGELQRLSEESPQPCEDACASQILNFSLAKKGNFSQLWDKYSIPHVGSWNAQNRQHCEFALLLHTSCAKNTCISSCARSRLSAGVWERVCADRWQSDYNKFVLATKKKYKTESELDLPDEHVHLWTNKVIHSVPPCDVCSVPVHKEREISTPDVCHKEYDLDEHVSNMLHRDITESIAHSSDSVAEQNDSTANDTGDSFNAELPVLVEEECARQCSQLTNELGELLSAHVTTNADGHNFHEFTWVKGWHFMDKLHCHVALSDRKWCERDACYRKCEANKSSITHNTSAASCEEVWGSDYDKGLKTMKEKAFKVLHRKHIPMDHVKRWWDEIVKTFEICDPCADVSYPWSVPTSCWTEYKIYTQVWYASLPEDTEHHDVDNRKGVFRTIVHSSVFYSVLAFVVVSTGCYCIARIRRVSRTPRMSE